jgi:hypothetical protein
MATPDVALVDRILQGEDAGSVVEALATRKVPLAVLTGAEQEVDRFREVIHKPVGGDTVPGAIDFLLGQRSHAD